MISSETRAEDETVRGIGAKVSVHPVSLAMAGRVQRAESGAAKKSRPAEDDHWWAGRSASTMPHAIEPLIGSHVWAFIEGRSVAARRCSLLLNRINRSFSEHAKRVLGGFSLSEQR
jgi:hypothetical protein